MIKKYFSLFVGKRVCFIGSGISNLPVLEKMRSAGVEVTFRDRKEQNSLESQDVKSYVGEGYLDSLYEDVFFLAPALRPDIPQLLEAARRGAYVTTEMREFLIYCKENGIKTIGVTGSDGKTTTTSLIAEMLRANGKKVWLGGNIGENLLSKCEEMTSDDISVVELSSFQLMKMDISPDIAAVTNISPNHLDWHTDMKEYIEAKKRIFAYQNTDSTLILNADDDLSPEYASKAPGKVLYTSVKKKTNGFWCENGNIMSEKGALIPADDILLPGLHNIYNACMAAAVSAPLCTEKSMIKVLRSFGGVPHRREHIATVNGVEYYNSSMDSSPTRTAACLESFEDKVLCICGGYDKNLSLDSLAALFEQKVRKAYLIGDTAEKIKTVLENSGFRNYTLHKSLEEAVSAAAADAVPGDRIVLSPAAASFGMFRDYADRGNTFRSIVLKLAEMKG